MSGGYFNYNQHKISDIIEELEHLIYEMENKDDTTNIYEGKKEAFLLVYKEALDTLKFAYMFTQRIDWFESGDDGIDSFFERVKEDTQKLIKQSRREV